MQSRPSHARVAKKKQVAPQSFEFCGPPGVGCQALHILSAKLGKDRLAQMHPHR